MWYYEKNVDFQTANNWKEEDVDRVQYFTPWQTEMQSKAEL